MSTIFRARAAHAPPTPRGSTPMARLLRLGYVVLVAGLLVLYVTMLSWNIRIGYDFSCFRAASILLAHGGNPYDAAQLWRQENLLYNLPSHLRGGTLGYYAFDPYNNPLLFAWVLTPLAALPYTEGYAIYTVAVVGCAVAGAWLSLLALGWTRHRTVAISIALIVPGSFLTVWWGQQSTLLFCTFGAALLALRHGRPGLGGALLALAWIKPHLLLPVILMAPLLMEKRAALRWCAGFGLTSGLAAGLGILATGPGSIAAWLNDLIGYSGHVDTVQGWIPSLAGTALVFAPHPWNRPLALAVMVCGLVVMVAIVAHARRARVAPLAALCTLTAAWLLFTPYVHPNDSVLALPALALAWRRGQDGRGRVGWLPVLTLWAVSALPLAFLLPRPLELLGLLPPIVVLLAAVYAPTLSSAGGATGERRPL